jgi:hypothetical protein
VTTRMTFLVLMLVTILHPASGPLLSAETYLECTADCRQKYSAGSAECARDFLESLPPTTAEYMRDNWPAVSACMASGPAGIPACLAAIGVPALQHYLRARVALDQYAICNDVYLSNLISCARICGRMIRQRRACVRIDPTTGKCVSPLVLDLDGDGFSFTSLTDGVQFDFDATGAPLLAAWTTGTSDDAFLVYDENDNGRIDSGWELFGDATIEIPANGGEPNGFNALAEFDRTDLGGNGDGVIDSRDRGYHDLLVWVDSNHDANAQATELCGLASAGVARIQLAYTTSSDVDAHGNELRLQSTYATTAGASRAIVDVYFAAGDPVSANFAPDAVLDSVNTPAGTAVTVNVLANDRDRELEAISLLGAGAAANGTVTLTPPSSVRYTPAQGFVGPDQFTYDVIDSRGAPSRGTVRVLVEGERVVPFGNPTDLPITGDWNGDGITDLGVYRPGEAKFYLAAAPGFAGAVIAWGTGNPEDVPVAGDWTGSGRDQVGLYRRSTSQFFLRDSGAATFPGRTITFGTPGGLPVIGRWDGRLPVKLGTWNPGTGQFSLQDGPPPFVYGEPGDQPVAGDWDGDGFTDVGVFRAAAGSFLLRRKDETTLSLAYGQGGDRAVSGDWTGVRHDGIGVFRSGAFRLNTASRVAAEIDPPIVRRQTAAATAVSQTSVTGTWSYPTHTGSLLVAVVSARHGSTSPVYPVATFTAPPGWQHAQSAEWNNVKTSVYYYPNNPGGRTAETFSTSGAFRDQIIQLIEYKNIRPSPALDRTATNGGSLSSGAVSTGTTPLTSYPREVVITALTAFNATTFSGASNGFVEIHEHQAGNRLSTAVHENTVGTAGAYGHTATPATPSQWIGVVVTFRGATVH